ncbi:MAG: DUF4403 family protein [Myxococcota bacterium]
MSLLLLLFACQCGRDSDEEGVPPRVGAVFVEKPPPPSTVVVPLSLPIADLERLLHTELPMTLVDKENEEIKQDGKVKGLLDLTVVRTDTPELAGLPDGRVSLSLPLSAEAKLHKGRRPPIKVTAAMRITTEVDLGLTEHWHLDSDLTLAYEWLEDPKFSVLGLKFNVRKKVDKKLEPKLPEIADKIEEALRKSDKLNQKMNQLWARIGEAQTTKGDPPGWFIVQPETVYLSRLTATETHLRLTAGLKGIAALGLGEPPSFERGPLPPIQPPPAAQGLRLPVDVGLSWDELSKLATEQVSNRKDKSLVVEGVELALALAGVKIYPSGDRLAVGLGYRSDGEMWSSDGTAWLLAEPVVDPKARKLTLAGFDYTVDTWDLAVDVANSDLVRDGVRDSVAQHLEFDYGDKLDEAVAKVNDRIAELKLPNGAGVLKAHVDSVDLQGVELLEDALLIRTQVAGTAEVALALPPKPE